jgi:hypothetical protein
MPLKPQCCSLNKYPFRLSLSKPATRLRQAQPERAFERLCEQYGLKPLCLLLCAALFSLPALAAPEGDEWSGRYLLHWIKGPAADEKTTYALLSIVRAPDADPDEPDQTLHGITPNTMAAPLKPDLTRWAIPFDDQREPEPVVHLRRLAPDEYKKHFRGIAALYAKNAIECLTGGYHIFFCRVKPGTTVDLDGGDKLRIRTGVFGARLHAGAFELTRLPAKP